MKKNFEYPSIKVIKVSANDIIATSEPVVDGNVAPNGPGADGFGTKPFNNNKVW